MRLLYIVLLPVLLGAADYNWTAVGPRATIEKDEGVVTFRYEAGGAQRSMAALPGIGSAFAQMKSVRFEVKTDSAFAVSFVLAEKKPEGGNYSAVVWSNGGDWQPVILSPADFSPTDGPTDPIDKDGKLDLDQVENAALLDMSQYLAGMARNPQTYAEPHVGPHFISIRNFEISGEDAPADRPQAAWFSPGGATFEQKNGALIVRYREREDRWTVFNRLIPPHDFTGATHLSLDIQSDRDAQLLISIRERRSGNNEDARHNIDFFVPAGTQPDHRDVLLSAFSGKPIDLTRIQSIAILDVSGEVGTNRIVIQDLRLKTIH
jgi:hypothetical protein